MKYINRNDLINAIQERMLDESIQCDEEIINNIEAETIDLVISYLTGRYDTGRIFGEKPLRNGVLVHIISRIVVHEIVRRNAARKVPDDYVNLYNQAIKKLENIQGGSMRPEGLPIVTAPGGGTAELMYGNNTNKNFFI